MPLPLLFVRLLARTSVRGVLSLAAGDRATSIQIVDGRACLSPVEYKAVIQAFSWKDGIYSFEPKEVTVGFRAAHSFVRLTAEGLRALIRSSGHDDVERAFGDRFDRAPVLRSDGGRITTRLGLAAAELRFVEQSLDGVATARALTRGGIGRLGAIEVLALMTIFGAVDWTTPRVAAPLLSLAAPLEARAVKMLAGNHFEVLGVHWSAPVHEMEEAHQMLQRQLALGGEWAAAAPDACARMRERVESAWLVLRDPDRRAGYRRSELSIDFDAAADLMERRAETLSMRGEAAASERTLADELARPAGDGKRKNTTGEVFPRFPTGRAPGRGERG